MHKPPYSLDLALADFFLFPRLKTPMKRKHFATIEAIKEKSKQKLLAIPKSALQKLFEDLKNAGWLPGIISEGDYFEGDEIFIDK